MRLASERGMLGKEVIRQATWEPPVPFSPDAGTPYPGRPHPQWEATGSMSNPPSSATASGLATAATPAWYQVTLSAIGDAVLTTDNQGRITYLNPPAESLTKWTASEAFGRPLEEVLRLVNEHTRQPAEQPVRNVLETGLRPGAR